MSYLGDNKDNIYCGSVWKTLNFAIWAICRKSALRVKLMNI